MLIGEKILSLYAVWPPHYRIFYSPLARAQKTTHIIASTLGLSVNTFEKLREDSFCEQEGKDKGAWLNAWWQDDTPLGAESLRALLQLVASGLNKEHEEPQNVLIVAHLAVYWAVEKTLVHAYWTEMANGLSLLNTPPVLPSGDWLISRL